MYNYSVSLGSKPKFAVNNIKSEEGSKYSRSNKILSRNTLLCIVKKKKVKDKRDRRLYASI